MTVPKCFGCCRIVSRSRNLSFGTATSVTRFVSDASRFSPCPVTSVDVSFDPDEFLQRAVAGKNLANPLDSRVAHSLLQKLALEALKDAVLVLVLHVANFGVWRHQVAPGHAQVHLDVDHEQQRE